MYQSSYSKVLGTQTLFTAEAQSGSVHIYYNNVIYSNEPNKNDWSIRTKVNDGKTVYIIHNTLIGYGRIQGADCSGYLYNNLVYGMHSSGGYADNFSSMGSPATRANNLVLLKMGILTVCLELQKIIHYLQHQHIQQAGMVFYKEVHRP